MPPLFSQWTLPHPQLTMGPDGTPRDDRHGDIYFQPGAGQAEGRHVFLDGVDFPEHWRNHAQVTLCELGFGTGLNALLTWEAWRALPQPRPRLRYLAIEGFPLTPDDMARALAASGVPEDRIARLLALLPPRQPGFHHLPLEPGMDVILAQGPVQDMLTVMGDPAREGETGWPGVDIWYLDGFAPASNPEMWSEDVLALIARRSAPGARLATFTAAGAVRRGLESHGFSVERRPGYGHKRHCVAARLERAAPTAPFPAPRKAADIALWPGRPLPTGARVAVIGGGVAGCAAVHALGRQGFDPILLEAREHLATEASGNPVGLFMPRLTAEPSADGRFHAAAWVHALHALQDLAEAGHPIFVGPKGLLCLPADARNRRRQRTVGTVLNWPPDWLTIPSAIDQARATGDPTFADPEALWMGASGCIRPAAICAALAGDWPRRLGFDVATMDRVGPPGSDSGGWRLHARDGRVEDAAAVVLCAGAQVAPLLPSAAPTPLITRGQISLFDAPAPFPSLALSFGGYLSPPVTDPDGAPLQILGATHEPMEGPEDPGWREIDPAGHAHCLDMLRQRLPEQAAHLADKPWRGRVSRRARTPDRRPLVGPLPGDRETALEILGGLRHGPRHRLDTTRLPEAFAPDLWILGGLGSRGFQTATLAAELLAAGMAGLAPPVEEDIRQALHPARFLVRALARGEVAP